MTSSAIAFEDDREYIDSVLRLFYLMFVHICDVTECSLELDLCHSIVPGESSFKVMSTKVGVHGSNLCLIMIILFPESHLNLAWSSFVFTAN